MRLKNKLSIITGAAQGVGLATALKFAEEGATGVLCDLRPEGVDAALAGDEASHVTGAVTEVSGGMTV